MENSCNDELFCSLKDELREVNAQINVHSEKLMDLLDQKKNRQSTDSREMSHLTPVIIEYRGNRSNMSLLCSMPSIGVG